MTLNIATINSLWASLLIEELTRLGVSQFVISPGSRSTPLVLAVADNPNAQAITHYDERGAAFFALGYARATQRPAAVICTSGTAVANYYPAVIEASMDCVPMILLTADRPPELRDRGANQTITQPGIFARYPRWERDIPCPSSEHPPSFILDIADEAYQRSTGSPMGPVHLNCMFREPLAPVKNEENDSRDAASLTSWISGRVSPSKNTAAVSSLSEGELAAATNALGKVSRPMLVVGGLRNRIERNAVIELAEHLQWPMIADSGSGLRAGRINSRINYFDLILASERFTAIQKPDAVLQIGSRLTSKRLLAYLEHAEPSTYLQLLDHPFPHDPIKRVTMRLQTDLASGVRQITESLSSSRHFGWLEAWKAAAKTAEVNLEKILKSSDRLSEPLIASLVSDKIPSDSAIWAASSMPIRDLDMFYSPQGPPVSVGCNRGASGIDGTIASAAGYACGTRRPVTLLIGDLAMLHDLNSLAILKHSDIHLTIVVINNNGGGIFGHLPIAEFGSAFERYFVVPHGLGFARAAEMFGIPYTRAESASEFLPAYRSACHDTRVSIIELIVDREANQRFHASLVTSIAAEVGKL
ncbi:MAG: 2-succinyl-5-enolpyruvyl-6-hydroxy-3-cyclohexene-1-carboxylic-acid synthase [candidate division Zixibacteria bacterium]|nr:2-succinyl-5-enolpyruvyl-6-hydroxy-3-cyclohexene-1-carboxylic-acid synthase [candidate division Zixibacteria bacterium]